MSSQELIAALREALGERAVLTGDDIGAACLGDIVGRRSGQPLAVLRPANTAEVSKALALCNAASVPVTLQGGRTGLVMGGVPREGEIVLALERMNQIESIDTDAAMATVQAGVVLQALEERLEPLGLIFPLDLGARGSCTIGGNISTNAGGNRVIRYGMTRELVVGLEVVLADGTVLDGLRPFLKNNTGPDLKQLFVGTEGTLGVVTRAILRLAPAPAGRLVALCALADFTGVRNLLRHVRGRLGGELTAFEAMWQSYADRAFARLERTPPLAPGHPFYVLVEASGNDREALAERFEDTLAAAMSAGDVLDVVITKSDAEVAEFWKVRDMSVEVSRSIDPVVAFDVSVAVADMETFVARAGERVRAYDERCEMIVFGHVGDGNLHLAVHAPADRPGSVDAVDAAVYGVVGEFGGSISAEHGIGILKRAYLGHSRTPAEIATIRALKNALDPKATLNPGRIIPVQAP